MAQDVDTIRRKGKEIGLLLNDKKCEFISKTAIAKSTNSAFQTFIHLGMEEAEPAVPAVNGAPKSSVCYGLK